MIKLYYVRGINRTDTPYFNTLVEQENYFNEKLISSIDAIYPPHYQNTIQFSNEDLDFNTQCNYLSLDFNGKTYYYFISDMEYITEDLIRITITMDTFQTFMFNIDYHNARLRRETIKRWNEDGTINRAYIREDYGSGVFTLDKYVEIENNYGSDELGFWVYYLTDASNALSPDRYSNIEYNGKSINNTDLVLIIPIPKLFISNVKNSWSQIPQKSVDGDIDILATLTYVNYYVNDSLEPFKSGTIKELFNDIGSGCVSNEKVYKALYFDRIPFKGMSINKRQQLVNPSYPELGYIINYDIRFDPTKFQADFTISPDAEGSSYHILELKYAEMDNSPSIIRLPFYKNDYLGDAFQTRYIPQLIDENYIEFKYGERLQTTTFPLSKLKTNTLYCYQYVDIFTSARSYKCCDNINGIDKYLTTINVSTYEYLQLISDSWKNFLANNMGSLLIGTALSVASAINPVIGGATKLYQGAMLAKSAKRKTYRGVPTKKLMKADSLQVSGTGDIIGGVSSALGGTTQMTNALFAPDKVKQGSNFTADYMTEGLKHIYYINYISNLKGVASVFESVGYLIDEYINGSPIRLNRQIYNYLQCSEIDLEITMLCSDDIISDIEDRFLMGLRLWNMTSVNYLDIQLGDVCVYDNVETQEEVTNE